MRTTDAATTIHTHEATPDPFVHAGPERAIAATPRRAGSDERVAGDGSLRVQLVTGRSAITWLSANSPLKILTPRRTADRDATAIISSYGGGLVSGDRLRVRVDVAAGARCRVGTQASTKVFRRTRERGGCGQTLEAVVGAGAKLVVAPDPVTCFADAEYQQWQRVELASGASLLLVDWFTSGRWACGERWAFYSYRSRTEITLDGRRALLDAVRLDASEGPIAAPHRCGRFDCFATVILIGPAFAARAAALLARLAGEPIERGAALIAGASPIAGGGAIFRAAGTGAEPVGRCIADYAGVELQR